MGRTLATLARVKYFAWDDAKNASVGEHMVFLKMIIPSRKATKQYLGE
jgi:hypothetical protein